MNTLYHTNEEIRKVIDGYLKQMVMIDSNLGKDSTEEERRLASEEYRTLERKIKEADPAFYEIITSNDIEPPTRDEMICAEFEATGKSEKELGEKYGLSESRIGDILSEYLRQ